MDAEAVDISPASVRLECRGMGRFGSRALLATCLALVLLLAALAVVQYRWSTRVAAADAQREKEHLESSASLFANQFNALAAQALDFLQNDGGTALRSGTPLAQPPKLIAELYALDLRGKGTAVARRLTGNGLFAPAAIPAWMGVPRCAEVMIDNPPAVIAPIFEVQTTEQLGAEGVQVMKRFRRQPDQCLVARIDTGYLRATLFPQLIEQSFGATAAGEYDFLVVARNRPDQPIYGRAIQPDLRKPFFSTLRNAFILPRELAGPNRQRAIFMEHVQSTIVTSTPDHRASLLGPGVWELDVAHRGMPLEAAFEQTRQRDLLLSVGVEALLVAAIAFLVIGARRMQRLADQKMQFVAGVSHELRTPVSAISMLSRNQADGLVTGEKVKQYGELIHQQSRRLNEMVEQTLQYAGIHSGRRTAQSELDVARLIQEAVDERRGELERSGFEVDVVISAGLPVVHGDAKLLRTAFDNLLDNAQKHASAGHWIRVSAAYAARDHELRISVEDRGAGIEPGDQAEIFEPFCRGRAAVEAQIPGSGLGLSLVRSAAEAHRGTVTVVSEPGRGSTFTMHLPV